MNYDAMVLSALELYGLARLPIQMMGHSDKLVYLAGDTEKYVVSLYIPATKNKNIKDNDRYSADEVVLAEANLMEMLANELPELGGQRPLRSKSGLLIEHLQLNNQSIPVRISTYISGATLDEASGDFPRQAYGAGRACALLHVFALNKGLSICSDLPEQRQPFLNHIIELLEAHHAEGTISMGQISAIRRGANIIRARMDELDALNQIGFVHTDIRSANLIDDGSRIVPIDYSRGVLSYPLYDLGEMCMHMGNADIQRQILGGYSSVRPLDEFSVSCIEAFAVMFIFIVSTHLIGVSPEWQSTNLPRIENYFVPNLEHKTLLPRDF